MTYSGKQGAYFQQNYEGLSHYVQTKYKLFDIIGHQCYFCDDTFPSEELEEHHINHDGHEDLERHKTRVSMYRYYVKHPEEAKQRLAPICVLCHTEYHRK
jgi:hypothetical protein